MNQKVLVPYYDTERSHHGIREEKGGAVGGGCPSNGKQPRMELAEKLNASRAQGIMGQTT